MHMGIRILMPTGIRILKPMGIRILMPMDIRILMPGAAVSLEIARRRRLTRDNGIPGHDNPPVWTGRAGTEMFIKIYFWTRTT